MQFSSRADGTPDGYGGIAVRQYPRGDSTSLVDLDGQTGAQVWQNSSFLINSSNPLAVGASGKVYVSGATGAGLALIEVDGTTGASIVRYLVPPSTETVIQAPCNGRGPLVIPENWGELTGPAVGPDGTVFAGIKVASQTTTYASDCSHPVATQQTLSLLKMAQDGSTTLSTINTDTTTTDPSVNYLSDVIPDGQGGALASWGKAQGSPSHITHISNSGTSDFTFSALFNAPSEMVLGKNNGTAYATDGFAVVHFNLPDGSLIWTYTPPSNNNGTNIIAGLDGDGLSILNSSGIPPYPQTLLSLDNTGTASSPGTTVTGLPSPFALGNWVGNMNGSLAMFTAAPNALVLSSGVTPQGNVQSQNAPPKLVFADFIPPPPCVGNSICYTAQKAGDHIKANGGPTALLIHRIFADNDDNFPATIINFLKESATARDGVAFIGHAYLQTHVPTTPPPYDGISYSIGLNFVDKVLIRTTDQSDPWRSYHFSDPQPTNIQFVSQINSSAKVVFIGSCDTLHDVVPGLWNINSQTQGQALVVPDLSTVSQSDPGNVDLWQATLAWEEIATNLAASRTIQQAVTAANDYLNSISSTLSNPPEKWKVVGDPNVQLRP